MPQKHRLFSTSNVGHIRKISKVVVLAALLSVSKIHSYVDIVYFVLKPLISDELFLKVLKGLAYLFWLMFESKLSYFLVISMD